MALDEKGVASHPAVITVAGYIGSGKSEVCRELSSRTGWPTVSAGALLRKMASDRGISVLEMNRYATSHPEVDLEIDQRVSDLKQSSEPVIVDSRMAWFFLPSSFKVYLVVEPLVAAQRVFRATRPDEVHSSVPSTLAEIEKRRQLERERYGKLYTVDSERWGNYDLIVDTTSASPQDVTTCILDERETGKGLKAARPRCWVSPQRLVPTQSVRGLANLRADAVNGPAEPEGSSHAVDIAVYQGSCLIVDGHERVSAALKRHQPFVVCRLIAFEDEEVLPQLTVSQFASTSTSLSSLYDWEEAHGFEFAAYPKWLASADAGRPCRQ